MIINNYNYTLKLFNYIIIKLILRRDLSKKEEKKYMNEKIWTKEFIFVCLSNFFVSLNF